MRLLIISDIDSIHTQRWVSSLSRRGHTIFLFGLLRGDASLYDNLANVTVFSCGFRLNNLSRLQQWLYGKAQYLKAVSILKEKIRQFQPDILHAHYASSYGLIGALANFHPYVISVWGSDVYQYPRAGLIYKNLLTYSLRRADTILSTSHCMAAETHKYTAKPIAVTPFGVNTTLFSPSSQPHDPSAPFTIGCVKTLSPTYGIDTLIQAFARLCQLAPDTPLRLLIAGKGPQEQQLRALADSLHISDRVEFLGFLPNKELPALYRQFDIACYLSRSESFGVAAIEAMACQCPVVASDADGFKEVVADNTTGLIVPREAPEAAAHALLRLLTDRDLRRSMATAARDRVLQLYDWERNVDTMEQVYRQVLGK